MSVVTRGISRVMWMMISFQVCNLPNDGRNFWRPVVVLVVRDSNLTFIQIQILSLILAQILSSLPSLD